MIALGPALAGGQCWFGGLSATETDAGVERSGAGRGIPAQGFLALDGVVEDPGGVARGIPLRVAPRLVRSRAGHVGELADPTAHIGTVGVEPQPLPDCQPCELEARSPSASSAMKCRAPCGHHTCRSLTRKLAVTIRTRLCIQPVAASWRIPASTNGNPVRPARHASKPALGSS